LKLACWFWRTFFFKFQCIFTLLLLSPLEQGRSSLNNLKPLSLRMICAKSGQNWPSVSGEEVENVKVYRRTDGRQTTGDQKSSLELSAQVS
jgi:hypothetical protein